LIHIGNTLDTQVEAPQPIPAETVRPSLQENGIRVEGLHDVVQHYAMDIPEIGVVEALVEGEVDTVVGALLIADIVDVAGSWEVLLELVEGACHHSICQVEGLLDSVSMVDIDVDVEYSLVGFQQFQNGQHTIVDVAEAACLALFGVMEPARPVNGDVTVALR
jgi:hypothetical protein